MIKNLLSLILILFILSTFLYFNFINNQNNNNQNKEIEKINIKVEEKKVENLELPKVFLNNLFEDTFDKGEILEETGNMEKSLSPHWWVNSGAFLIQENGIARTLFGALEEDSEWQIKYSNGKRDIPEETDGGYYPQNIFRLITKSKWQNFRQEAYFKIVKYNLSNSKHRSESNGLLFFSRYKDQYNLYYAGIRVDGTAVIKKKINKEYYIISQGKIFDGEFDKKINPNLLPINQWIGIRNEIKTVDRNKVEIKIFIDEKRTGNWELVLVAIDDGKSYGGEAILSEEYAGIRTDFMDVKFDNYKIEDITD
ncbi:MAG: hypothetical protein KAI16_01580 [Candidatus Pacebacteria bacterium]|nr:hypothetical protein [Candidatus Paceibacterota bacterium]